MKRILLPLLLILALLAACGPAPAPINPTADLTQLDTAVVLTLTGEVPTATPRPLPSSTPEATFVQPTQHPTSTALPARPTLTPTPGSQATPLPGSLLPGGVAIEGIACLPGNAAQDLAVVLKVIDGETLQVMVNGATQVVRYIGIQTPPLNAGGKPAKMAPEAFQKNQALTSNQVVVLIKDASEKDAKGTLLRYVVAGNVFVNLELVKLGLAASVTIPPNVACQKTFDAAQAKAMQAKIGVWIPTPTLPLSVTATFKPSDH